MQLDNNDRYILRKNNITNTSINKHTNKYTIYDASYNTSNSTITKVHIKKIIDPQFKLNINMTMNEVTEFIKKEKKTPVHNNAILYHNIIYENDVLYLIYEHTDYNNIMHFTENVLEKMFDYELKENITKNIIKQIVNMMHHFEKHNIYTGKINCNNIHIQTTNNNYTAKYSAYGYINCMNNENDNDNILYVNKYPHTSRNIFNIFNKQDNTQENIWMIGLITFIMLHGHNPYTIDRTNAKIKYIYINKLYSNECHDFIKKILNTYEKTNTIQDIHTLSNHIWLN